MSDDALQVEELEKASPHAQLVKDVPGAGKLILHIHADGNSLTLRLFLNRAATTKPIPMHGNIKRDTSTAEITAARDAVIEALREYGPNLSYGDGNLSVSMATPHVESVITSLTEKLNRSGFERWKLGMAGTPLIEADEVKVYDDDNSPSGLESLKSRGLRGKRGDIKPNRP